MVDDFIPKPTAASPLPFAFRPTASVTLVSCASEQDSFEAYVHEEVLRAISHEAKRAAPNETIGLLAGRVMRDDRGPYTLVLAAEGARKDEIEASSSHVNISARGQVQLRRRLESSAYGLDLVGWYHSHPTFPARFSGVDMAAQSSWGDHNHLGVVFSGLERCEPFGVYRGANSNRLLPSKELIPFVCDCDDCQRGGKFRLDAKAAAVSEHHSAQAPDDSDEQARPIYPPVEVKSKGFGGVLSRLFSLALIGAIASMIWLSQRLRVVENRLAGLAEDGGAGRPASPPHTRPSSSPEQTAEKTGSTGDAPQPEKQTPPDYSPVRANPKLPPPVVSGSAAPPRKGRKGTHGKGPGRKSDGGARSNDKAPETEKTAPRTNPATTSTPKTQATPSPGAGP